MFEFAYAFSLATLVKEQQQKKALCDILSVQPEINNCFFFSQKSVKHRIWGVCWDIWVNVRESGQEAAESGAEAT